MTRDQLYKELDYVNHSRENRKKYAFLVIDNPELLPIVMDILSIPIKELSLRLI